MTTMTSQNPIWLPKLGETYHTPPVWPTLLKEELTSPNTYLSCLIHVCNIVLYITYEFQRNTFAQFWEKRCLISSEFKIPARGSTFSWRHTGNTTDRGYIFSSYTVTPWPVYSCIKNHCFSILCNVSQWSFVICVSNGVPDSRWGLVALWKVMNSLGKLPFPTEIFHMPLAYLLSLDRVCMNK